MTTNVSILFTRSLEKGEGAAAQQAEVTRVLNGDIEAQEKKGYKFLHISHITESGPGMLKFFAVYGKDEPQKYKQSHSRTEQKSRDAN